MFRSLRARLGVLLLLQIAAAIAAGLLMVGLFRQSTSERVGQAEAQAARACDAITEAYRFYTSGWHSESAALDDAAFRAGLNTVVQTALRRQAGFEGGIWRQEVGSLAYGFPTYEGSGPKTDLPLAEMSRIREINRKALAEDHLASSRNASASQTLLLTGCPLSGPIPKLTAWTLTRVFTFAGRAYSQLMTGLVVLLATVLAATALLTRIALTWSRHVSRIEGALARHDIEELPMLQLTGERELDRIVTALNDAGVRLAEARRRADSAARQMAVGERLAAIGRVAAGVAHEIRNPIAAMRLKAENALNKGAERYQEALDVILGQIERLDRVLRRLLDVTEPVQPHPQRIMTAAFLQSCVNCERDLAAIRGLRLEYRADIDSLYADPELLRGAVDNLLLNAIQAAPAGSAVELTAIERGGQAIISVRNQGPGPPVDIRDRLFEPFVTGRPDGTGLGLSIVRETVEAHGGRVHFVESDHYTTFEILLPWRAS
jgi:signal transduction histidine kinase